MPSLETIDRCFMWIQRTCTALVIVPLIRPTWHLLVYIVKIAYRPTIVAVIIFLANTYRTRIWSVIRGIRQVIVEIVRFPYTREIRRILTQPAVVNTLTLLAPVLLWMLYKSSQVEGWPHYNVEQPEYACHRPLPAWEVPDNIYWNMDRVKPYFEKIEMTVLQRRRYLVDGSVVQIHDFRFAHHNPYEPPYW
ncbi:hypothetical protein F5B19DRAFT_171121 [Rostrohypoxylon terebratum]|nr:hypothetical protein F5B19DRAFT_171121 [Rostrohypoxylon terebratum]